MKKYEKYKDSGVEWLGEIPEHWKPISMKYYFYMKGRIGWQGLKAEEFKKDGPYLVTGTDFENGRVLWERCYHISEDRYNEAPEIHVQSGDILITKDGTVGKLALIEEKPEKVSLNSHLLILRPLTQSIYNHYIYWALQSINFKYYIGLAQNGSIMASLSQEKIGDYVLPLPTIKEQEYISKFLWNKTSIIDSIISEKQSLIDDLQSYRMSIITEAVTRGLNSDVPMKDSGVEWLGKIPKHWKVMKTSTAFDIIGSGTTPNTNDESNYDDCGINWLQTGDLNDGYIKETSKKISYKAYEKNSLKLYPKNSLVIAMYGATIGKLGILDIETTTNQACCVLFSSSIMLIKFAFYIFMASKRVLITLASGGGQPNISQGIIKNFRIPVPPTNEQQNIVSYLDSKVEKISASISELISQIKDLQDYRSALITEAVTGKIDLREWKGKTN